MTGTDQPTVIVTRHPEVTAALADSRCVVPEAPAVGTIGAGIGWLRSSVSRFSTGDSHIRRRALAQAALADVDPTTLRRRGAALSHGSLEQVPATALADALGIRHPVGSLVATIARGYFPNTDSRAEADVAVDALVTVLGGRYDETTAAKIGILVQAHDATVGLVVNTLTAYDRVDGCPTVEAMLAETLRHDPPVRVMRRVCARPYLDHAAGTLLLLDIAAANRDPDVFADPDRFDPYRPHAQRHVTFGAGPRSCPGREHGTELAAGIVEAVRARMQR
jgi:cytochrome P450